MRARGAAQCRLLRSLCAARPPPPLEGKLPTRRGRFGKDRNPSFERCLGCSGFYRAGRRPRSRNSRRATQQWRRERSPWRVSCLWRLRSTPVWRFFGERMGSWRDIEAKVLRQPARCLGPAGTASAGYCLHATAGTAYTAKRPQFRSNRTSAARTCDSDASYPLNRFLDTCLTPLPRRAGSSRRRAPSHEARRSSRRRPRPP